LSTAYLDSSCLVAIAFDEPGAKRMVGEIEGYDEIVASNLLEAEVRSALSREGIEVEPPFLAGVSWLLPDRPLGDELRLVLSHGYLRGADAWHLATALWLAASPRELPFLTLDHRQRDVAGALGFPTPG
jgi:predicted nucleic acid-binding protein